MERHDTRSERPGLQELQRIDAHVLEYARPFSARKWKYQKAQLIHEAMLEHGTRQLAHAILHQTRARLLLELPDLLSNISLYECRVPLKRLFQGSGYDIFGHPIDLVCHFPFPGRPNLGEGFVGLTPHHERIWHEQKIIEIRRDIRAMKWKKSASKNPHNSHP
jgi:hypothetical protein